MKEFSNCVIVDTCNGSELGCVLGITLIGCSDLIFIHRLRAIISFMRSNICIALYDFAFRRQGLSSAVVIGGIACFGRMLFGYRAVGKFFLSGNLSWIGVDVGIGGRVGVIDTG